MGAPSAQVQSSQTSQPASKGAGVSPSTPSGSGKGGQMSAMSGQPQMGQPNTNGNTGLAPIDPGYNANQANASFVAQPDGNTPGNPYPNTIGGTSNPAGQPMGKGGGESNSASSGKGA